MTTGGFSRERLAPQRAHAGDQQLAMWADIWAAVYQAIDD